MQLLYKYISEGWPKNKNKVPEIVRKYHNYSDELTVIDGLIFKSNKLVIPVKLRKEMLNLIHYNHLGVEKSKNRAREVLFWPSMSKYITDL